MEKSPEDIYQSKYIIVLSKRVMSSWFLPTFQQQQLLFRHATYIFFRYLIIISKKKSGSKSGLNLNSDSRVTSVGCIKEDLNSCFCDNWIHVMWSLVTHTWRASIHPGMLDSGRWTVNLQKRWHRTEIKIISRDLSAFNDASSST